MTDPTSDSMRARSPASRPPRAVVRLLGLLEVLGPAGRVHLVGVRQRTLVALLALRVGEIVTYERLVDGLWGEDPPVTAMASLRSHVARVRRALADADLPEVLATRGRGYSLDLDPGSVDAWRFEWHVSAARRESAREEPARVAEELSRGLDLWRADVLVDCQVWGWADGEAARLRELRLSATEDRWAAGLRSAGPVEAIGELERLVGAHPLRERLWELLMAALHLTGRPGEALAVYQRARAVLAAALGVEPGTAMRRLHAAILADNAKDVGPQVALDVPRRPHVASGLPVPLTELIGRDSELDAVIALLRSHRLITLTGAGGCGKTRLGIAVASHVAGDFADGACFADLSPIEAPIESPIEESHMVAATVVASLGLRVRPGSDPERTLIAGLRDCELLLVLDNCEHVRDGCRSLVRRLLSACPRVRVLATTRIRLAVPGELVRHVPPLPVPDPCRHGTLAEVMAFPSAQLFQARVWERTGARIAEADARALARVCVELDGLPLALELAAATKPMLTMSEIADRLGDRLHVFSDRATMPSHRSLNATLDWSYELLSASEQALLRRLAVFAGGFTLDAAQALWPEETLTVLGALVDKSVVMTEQYGSGSRYRLLETVRAYAAERLARTVSGEEAEARDAHAEYFLRLVRAGDRREDDPEDQDRFDRLAGEHDNLRAAMSWVSARQSGDTDPRFVLALRRYFDQRDHHQGTRGA
ncbi:AfsR/SARP family transcriptional regulator [Sphaerisporangium album]|uniref:AfsR/SARP family transcriptional regulator n=1 Tax=Sphaerisporangium album TaxID=509200 RepID=A0A367FNL1_9ACTN|nr:BTAD domain-containing putative transcriptional regulator [Sphaerisporangium album]RCG31270.1 AfsR/SARP family transcriptional regulator [Sphaerisporangium album]